MISFFFHFSYLVDSEEIITHAGTCSPARTQTFENWGATSRSFSKDVAEVKQTQTLRSNCGAANLISGRKLHDFEIGCHIRGWVRTHPFTYGPGIRISSFMHLHASERRKIKL